MSVVTDHVQTEPAETHTGGASLLSRLRDWIPFAVLALLVAVVTAAQPSFLSAQSLRGLLISLAPLMLLALGQMFVILTGGIDLSIGVVASLGTVLVALWVPPLGFLGAALAVVATAAVGAINGWIVAYFQVPSFIVTLGAMGFWGAIALWLSGAATIRVADNYESIQWLSNTRVLGVPTAAFVAISTCLAIYALTRVLKRGDTLHGMGLAEPAIIMSGISTIRWRIFAFAMSGMFAGLAAVIMVAAQRSGGPTLADSMQLPAIAAVVVGGTAITGGVGNALKVLIGSVIIVILRVGLAIVGIPPVWEQVVYGAVIIAAVALTIDRSRLKSIK